MVMLDEGKAKGRDIAKDELNQSGSTNAAVNMAISGARGSMDNLTMMAGSIGQAKVRGKRLRKKLQRQSSCSLQERRTRCSRQRFHFQLIQERSRAYRVLYVVSFGRESLLIQRFVLLNQICKED